MSKTLILKLSAAGDVVRTTTLLHRLDGHITWVTAQSNMPLINGLRPGLRCLCWEERARARDCSYDLVLNLEDDLETARFATSIESDRIFGAIVDHEGRIGYTTDASRWFDLGLISAHGRRRADELKYRNRSSFQELIYGALGWHFSGEPYLLPDPKPTKLAGDVALAPTAGLVWPMKAWAHYDALKNSLEAAGLRVSILPQRASILQHIADIRQHRCLVGADSLPMHLALGSGVRCVTLFNCTSPWEIHSYGLQIKLVSPLLREHFYSRKFDHRALTAITLEAVVEAVQLQIACQHSSARSPS
jgi:ADP-heptose:LPS heptosyltransferase